MNFNIHKFVWSTDPANMAWHWERSDAWATYEGEHYRFYHLDHEFVEGFHAKENRFLRYNAPETETETD